MRYLLSVAVLVVCAGVLSAATINVPADQPTIQAGIDAAVDGDTVLVAPGTYTENIDYSSKDIKVVGSGGAELTFIQPAISAPIVRIVSSETTGAELSGFTVQFSGDYEALQISNASPTVCFNIFFENRSGAMTGYAALSTGGASASHIHHNLFNHNGGVANVWISSPANFHNNTIVNSYRAGLIIYHDDASAENNIIVGCPLYGIVDDQYSPYIDYNDIYGNTPDYAGVDPGPNDISEDPRFNDTANGDFTLQIVSPCINSGDPDPQFDDPDGTRNDMGAYNYHWTPPFASDIAFGPYSDTNNVYSLTPSIYWTYFDTSATIQNAYHIQIGTDTNWSVAEMWDSGEVSSSDTEAVYAGDPLSDNTTYYLRIRLNNGTSWGQWMDDWFYVHVRIINVPSDQLTIQAAVDAAIPLDTVMVAAGIYQEHITIDKNIVLKTVDGAESTIIEAVYAGFVIIQIEGGVDNNMILDGFTIRNATGAAGIDIAAGSNPIIKNNKITDNGYFGINGHNCTGIIIESNLIERSYNYGVLLTGSNSLVSNNIFKNDDLTIGTGQNNDILNNTFDSGGNYSIHCINAEYTRVKNNVVVNTSGGYGIHVESISEIEVSYNDLFNNALGDYFGVLPDTGNISEDPQFSGIPGNEYYLLGSSPCIDAGDPSDPVPDGGGIRIDMGALEYTGLVLDFSLSTPLDSTVLFTYVPSFEWEELPNNTDYGQLEYSLYIDDNNDFSSPLQYDAGTAAILTIPTPLPSHGFWYWKVRAYNDTTTIWSNEVFKFRIDYTPDLPELISPVDGDSVFIDEWLMWTEAYDADSDDTVTYTLEIDDNSDFASPEATEIGISSEPSQKDGIVGLQIQNLQDYAILQNNTFYFWRVKAIDKFGGESDFTDDTATFLYSPQAPQPTPPETPVIVSPADGEEAVPNTWLTWEESLDADLYDTISYTIEIDDNDDFSSPEVNESGITDSPGKSLAGVQLNSLTDYGNLQDDVTYFWRIKAVDKFALESPFTDGSADFMYNSVNSQPSPPTAGFYPSDDITINNLQSTISWHPGTDPDQSDNGSTLHYKVWIDDDGEFITDYEYEYLTADGVPSAATTTELSDETHWDYVIQTIDDEGLVSDWSEMQSFWTNSQNDTPFVYSVSYPTEGVVHEMLSTLTWEVSVETDPMDSVYYTLYLAVDEDFNFVFVTDSIWDNEYTLSDSLDFSEQYWWKVKATDNTGLLRYSSNSPSFWTWTLGDIDHTHSVDISDLVMLVDWMFSGGPAPDPTFVADFDGSCSVDISDLVYLVDFMFSGGPAPLVGCGASR